jgi:N6-L-threonylcarbamoyladenine synthase
MLYLGLDTSNYTTSAAVFDSETGTVKKYGKLLPVREGERGVRQSDALFHHTVQLPEVLGQVMAETGGSITAVGVSSRPTTAEGSYMPCFLAGLCAGETLGTVNHIPVHKTSHQAGHILAALYSADKLDLLKNPFNAVHVSGGTTELLLCTPHPEEIVHCECIAKSADLKAGQLIDRVGVLLGLPFPCGPKLEKLALKQKDCELNKLPKITVPMKNGNPCFSGAENIAAKMFADGVSAGIIARFVLEYTELAVRQTVMQNATEDTVVFAGGVMSNSIIREKITSAFAEKSVYFAAPGYSSDNAVGTAIYGYLKDTNIRGHLYTRQ